MKRTSLGWIPRGLVMTQLISSSPWTRPQRSHWDSSETPPWESITKKDIVLQDNFPDSFDHIESVLSLGGPTLPQLPFVDHIDTEGFSSGGGGGSETTFPSAPPQTTSSPANQHHPTTSASDILDNLCYSVIHNTDLTEHQQVCR